MSNQVTYSIKGDTLQEDARMEMPFDYSFGKPSKGLQIKLEAYERHIASLKSFSVLPGSVWPKKEGLIEGVDFWIDLIPSEEWQPTYNNPDDPPVERYAVPLPREERQERLFTLEELEAAYTAGWMRQSGKYKVWEEFQKYLAKISKQ